MRATNDTTSAPLVRRIARAIGAISIASGIAVTGVATSASADTVVPLHTATSNDNAVTGSGSCDDLPASGTSYWHFVFTDGEYGFVSFSLDLGDQNALIVPQGGFSSDGSGKPNHAYVAVPAGKTLSSLQLGGSSATVTPTLGEGSKALFNLSHTCTGVIPPVDVCDNIDGDQANVPSGYTSDGEGTCTLIPPPVDVCVNLQGNQAEIPTGMISDGDGGCITPPPPVDLCNNLQGDQAEIPTGMISDGNGGCLPPAGPPTDLCTNIDGLQTTVPAGYSVDGTTCTPPPVDVCNNVDGDQAAIPEGSISNGTGGCATALVSSEAPAPSQIDLCSNLSGDQLEVPNGYALANGSCELVASEAVTPPAELTLPVTGSNTMSGIAIGLAMVGAGLILSALARRRSARNSA